MKLDIVRQPLFPAILTLTALTITALWGAGAPAMPSPETALEAGTAASTYTLAFPPLEELFARFQHAFPLFSQLITGILILFSGMCIGRIAIRYNLYAVSTCLPISLYAIVACGIGVGDDYLAAFTASALLALAVKNYANSYSNEYRFDALFRASFFLGLVIIIYTQALALALLLPVAILIFRRTLRETIVASVGLLLPILLLCYVNWGAGGSFLAPLMQFKTIFAGGISLHLFSSMGLPTLILLGVILLLNIFTLLVFLRNLYAVGNKPRFILLYNIGILLLTILTAFGASAASGCFTLLAVPSALLLPVLFIHVNRKIAQPIYLLLFAATFVYKIITITYLV